MNPGDLFRYQKGADAPLASRRVGHGKDQHDMGGLAAGDELLLALEDPIRARPPRPAAQRPGVGAGLRFGERKGAQYLAPGHGRQPACLLRVAPEIEDWLAGQSVLNRKHRGAGRVCRGDLLHDEGVLQAGPANAIKLFGQQEPQEALRRHGCGLCGGIGAAAVPLRRTGGDHFLGEAPHAVPQQPFIL